MIFKTIRNITDRVTLWYHQRAHKVAKPPQKILNIQAKMACTSRLPKTLDFLLSEGASTDFRLISKDIDYYTPLEYAAENNDLSVMSVLIKHGCDVNKGASARRSPLIAAVHRGKTTAAQFLIDNGAKVTPRVIHRAKRKVPEKFITHLRAVMEEQDKQILSTTENTQTSTLPNNTSQNDFNTASPKSTPAVKTEPTPTSKNKAKKQKKRPS